MNGTKDYFSNGTLIPYSECTLQNCDLSRSPFDYPPLVSAAVAYLVYFAIFFVAHIFLGIWYKTWSFLAGVFSYLLIFLLGYVAVVKLHFNPFNGECFSLYMVGLTISPTFLILSLHRCTEQVMVAAFSGELSLPFRPRTYLYSMIGLDSLGLIFQIAGVAVLAANTTTSTSQIGARLATTGLAIQCLTLALALGVWSMCGFWVYRYIRTMRLAGTWTATKEGGKEGTEAPSSIVSKRFQSFIWAMIAVLLTLLVRTLSQAVVVAGGREGQQLRIQSLYHGEGICMAIAVLILSICHPGFGLRDYRKSQITEVSRTLPIEEESLA